MNHKNIKTLLLIFVSTEAIKKEKDVDGARNFVKVHCIVCKFVCIFKIQKFNHSGCKENVTQECVKILNS